MRGIYHISERGGYPNGLKGPPGRDDGTGALENAIVMLMLMLFPRRPLPAYTGGMDSAGSGKKNVGG